MNVPGRWIPVPALALSLLLGCSKSDDAADAAAGDGTPALNTNIEIVKADVPARYAAALPTRDAAMQHWLQEGDDTLPPFVHVRDLMLMGDEKMFARVAAAAKSVPAAESESWAHRLHSSLQFEPVVPEFCKPLRAVMQAPASTLRRALGATFAAQCAGDDDLALIVRNDTPDNAVLEYYTSFYQPDKQKHPYDPRFATAARKSIVESERPDRRTAFVLARHPDPRARAALRKFIAEIRDPERADQVALAFYDAPDPKDRALGAAACERSPKDPVCDASLKDIGGGVYSPNEDEDEADPVEPADPAEPPKPSPAAIKATIDKLAAAGFGKVTSVDPATAGTDSAHDILTLAGHAWWFDVETGTYPNNHDSLMRHLSALAAPDLDGVIYEEIAPPMEDETDTKPYILTAYTSGKRLRAEARNFGDWYDAEAVINLMNAVAKESGSNTRFVALASDDQTMSILAGPAGAIARAIKAGLIDVGGANEAKDAGKSFEEKVVEAFKN